jgi:hypothetical protein
MHMGNGTRGRPRAEGERYPSGKLKPAAASSTTEREPISGALWQRMLADGKKIFGDARFGTEITRLGAIGELTSAEVATGIRIAGVYGRFEYYKNLRRSAASPHYIREYISQGAGSDTELVNFRAKEGRERDRSFNPDDRDAREAEATRAFVALQESLAEAPRTVRFMLERLCVENAYVDYQGRIAVRLGLAIAKQHFVDEEKGVKRKDRRKRKPARLAIKPPPVKVKPLNAFKDAFVRVQQKLSPHLAPEDIDRAWEALCALKAREDFRREKSEGGST